MPRIKCLNGIQLDQHSFVCKSCVQDGNEASDDRPKREKAEKVRARAATNTQLEHLGDCKNSDIDKVGHKLSRLPNFTVKTHPMRWDR
eukprot:4525883-Amphidinium_carterae.1